MKSKKREFLSTLTRDRWLMLLCLLLAFLTWHGVQKNIGNEITVSDVLVEVQVPEGWAVWEKSLSRVNILFRGAREDMLYLNNDQLKVVIPVEAPIAGEEVAIKISDLFLKNPTDSKVVRFNPPEIVVRLDQEATKLLPIKASIQDEKLPVGIEVNRLICTPASIKVSGAKEVLDSMTSILTTPIRLKDRQTSFKESIPVALPDGARIRIEPEWVSVEVQLSVKSDEKEFKAIPVNILSNPGEDRLIRIEPQVVNLTVQGHPLQLEKLTSSDLFAFIRSAELTEFAGYDMPVEIKLPAGLSLASKAPVIHVEVSNLK